ncbi:MAE_28990/MAE_18760 family HEPN-like nuclease [Sessilibacter corallicola]|uniref:MAE-28990/MAE-18760-like HEPN domain-containing protein n=1 Tax=Sessilibacter corallicola TaxID=2904075 RepID=A0ABQ0A6V1_9GAMM
MNQGRDTIERIESDLGWRKKEVSNLLLLEKQDNQILIIKSTLLLLYSHWEGFIKNACKVYLEHISNKKININDLTENFKAITLKGLILEVYKSSETLTLSNELNFLQNFNGTKSKVFSVKKNFSKSEKDKSIINTKDNLSLNVFKSILRIIGIDYSDSIDTKSAFIDEKLLGNRNKVAHGNKIESIDEDFDLSLDELKKVKDVVFYLMDNFSDDLIYFVENELYFESNKNTTDEYLQEKAKKIRSHLP